MSSPHFCRWLVFFHEITVWGPSQYENHVGYVLLGVGVEGLLFQPVRRSGLFLHLYDGGEYPFIVMR